MFCKLQRFYRFSNIFEWFDVPQGVMQEMLEMIPILEAEENLKKTTVNAVSSGNLKKSATNKIISGWERLLDKIRPKRKFKSQEEYDSTIQGLGDVAISKKMAEQLYVDE